MLEVVMCFVRHCQMPKEIVLGKQLAYLGFYAMSGIQPKSLGLNQRLPLSQESGTPKFRE
jgi:hypothetical protein